MTIPKEFYERRRMVRLLGGPLDNKYVSIFEGYGKMLNQRNNHYAHTQDFLMSEQITNREGRECTKVSVLTYIQKPGNPAEWVYVDRRA